MSKNRDFPKITEGIICEECSDEATKENWVAEFEGRNLCRGCLEAIAWIRGFSRGEDTPNNPCPICGAPMADYSTLDELFFHCEDCDKAFVDRSKGIELPI